jgi:ATP-dependent DNA ligase
MENTVEDFIQGRPMVAKSAKSVADALTQCDSAELKHDGMRITLVRYPDGSWDVLSRTLKSQKGKMPHIDKITANLPLGTVLDGEAILFYGGQKGTLLHDGAEIPVHIPNFTDTMRVMGSNPEKAVRRQHEYGVNVSVVVFDMPWHNNIDLTQMHLSERRTRYHQFVNEIGHENLLISPEFDLSQENIDRVFALGGEGLMAKITGAGSEYHAGARTGSWRKLKFVQTSDVVIEGFTDGEGKYAHLFGAVNYSQYRDGVLTLRGKCSGMTDEVRVDMHRNPEKYIGKVMEIAHMGIAKDSFRHPRFVRLRDDKNPTDCVWDNSDSMGAAVCAKAPARKKATAHSSKPTKTKAKTTSPRSGGTFEPANALVASQIARCVNASSDKYYQVFASRDGDDYIAWARYGKWDSDNECPKTQATTPIPCSGASLEEAVAAANKKLKSKLGKGYRGQLI